MNDELLSKLTEKELESYVRARKHGYCEEGTWLYSMCVTIATLRAENERLKRGGAQNTHHIPTFPPTQIVNGEVMVGNYFEVKPSPQERIVALQAEVERLRSPKLFPIQNRHRQEIEKRGKPGPDSIPWSVAQKAYNMYQARYGSEQSLERLAQRGGFSLGEMDMFYPEWEKEISELEQLRVEIERLRKEAEERERWIPLPGESTTEPPFDGEPVLILTDHSWTNPVHRAIWTDAIHTGIFSWAVEDCKFGPYPLRAYTKVIGWRPLPAPPEAEQP